MKRAILLSALACLLFAAPAMADILGTAEARYVEVRSPYYVLNVYAGEFNPVGAEVGIYRPEVRNSGVPGLQNTIYDGFCIEMQYSVASWYSVEVRTLEQAPVPYDYYGSPMGGVKADAIRELWAEHYADTGNALGAAAFQAAVWEIVYENDEAWDVTHRASANGAAMTGDSSVLSLANQWLADVADVGGPLASGLVALTNPDAQDYIVQIPAPAAVLLGALGLGLAGWLKRRVA